MKKQYVHFSKKVSDSEDTSEFDTPPPKPIKPVSKKVDKVVMSNHEPKPKVATVKDLKSISIKPKKAPKQEETNSEAWTGMKLMSTETYKIKDVEELPERYSEVQYKLLKKTQFFDIVNRLKNEKLMELEAKLSNRKNGEEEPK